MPDAPLLAVRGLVVEFAGDGGVVRAVDGVGFELPEGGSLGLVGESGCGKSVTAASLLRLVPEPPSRRASGSITFRGTELTALAPEALRRVRGAGIAMVFQDPMSALNPVLTVGAQLVEALTAHADLPAADAKTKAISLLREVGVPAPERRFDAFPHQLSGGLRQRVVLAMALAPGPALLVADEPTTALDATVQAQVLDLLARERRTRGLALLLISHDLDVIASQCERTCVMYAGRIVEEGPTAALFAAPAHPYTGGLLRSRPRPDDVPGTPLRAIPGVVPPMHALPSGCRFRDRCDRAAEDCASAEPALVGLGDGRRVACLHPLGRPA